MYSGKSIFKDMFFLIIFFLLESENSWYLNKVWKHKCNSAKRKEMKNSIQIESICKASRQERSSPYSGVCNLFGMTEWSTISLAFWNQITQKVNHSQKSVFHHMWKVMRNIDRFYTLCRDWGKEELKEKIGSRINDPARAIIFFKYLKLLIVFFFITNRVQKFKCRDINLWN